MNSVLSEFWLICLKQFKVAVLSPSLLELKNLLKLIRSAPENYRCPICSYEGIFFDYINRYDARCPRCGSLERHRMQIIVFNNLLGSVLIDSCLHFAPEPFISPILRKHFDNYITTDLVMNDVDMRMDVTKMNLKDCSIGFIYISHVLEHVSDDVLALKEIYRVLKPDGIALIAVPVLYEKTIEYDKPNILEFGHVRGIGPDYFEKVKNTGFRVEIFTSNYLSDDTCRTRYRYFKDYKNDIPDYVAICQK